MVIQASPQGLECYSSGMHLDDSNAPDHPLPHELHGLFKRALQDVPRERRVEFKTFFRSKLGQTPQHSGTTGIPEMFKAADINQFRNFDVGEELAKNIVEAIYGLMRRSET